MVFNLVWARRPRMWAVAAALLVVPALAAWQTARESQPRLARLLVERLEARFERTRVDNWAHVTGLVVLGGNPGRVVEAMRIAREHGHLRIVLSSADREELELALTAEGVDPGRIEIESESVNTYGNARYAKAMAAPRHGERWLLVTSASHMPRAIGTFYRVGFVVEPWPVVDIWHQDWWISNVARHEWLGLLAYWVRGRTIAVFPGPSDIARASRG